MIATDPLDVEADAKKGAEIAARLKANGIVYTDIYGTLTVLLDALAAARAEVERQKSGREIEQAGLRRAVELIADLEADREDIAAEVLNEAADAMDAEGGWETPQLWLRARADGVQG